MTKWGEDDLSKFLDLVHVKQVANRTEFARPYDIILEINDCLLKAGKNLVNPKPVMAGMFLLRGQYAFKTAAGMALAGQIVETFVMMRSALEYAGYALLMFEKPELQVVFMDRHQDEEAMKLNKQKFKISEVRSCIARFDVKLAENFDLFYQRTIDFGGHPNPHATNSATLLDEKDGSMGITSLAISADKNALVHALKSVAQVGLTILYIFQHIFKEKFELLGIKAAIANLTQNAGL